MATWEYVLFGLACLIAMSSLAQLMRARRSKLVAELQRQAEHQRRQSAERKSAD